MATRYALHMGVIPDVENELDLTQDVLDDYRNRVERVLWMDQRNLLSIDAKVHVDGDNFLVWGEPFWVQDGDDVAPWPALHVVVMFTVPTSVRVYGAMHDASRIYTECLRAGVVDAMVTCDPRTYQPFALTDADDWGDQVCNPGN